MLKHPSAATTRQTRSAPLPLDRVRRLLVPTRIITSPETNLQYRIDRLLGEGGFGQVYLAKRLGDSSVVPETVCIKVSAHMDGWLREAYFGQLLDDHPRAIRVFHGMPSAQTTVVVRGRPNPLQAAGRDAGLKLMEIKRLRQKGHRITLLNETQFWRLAGRRFEKPRRVPR